MHTPFCALVLVALLTAEASAQQPAAATNPPAPAAVTGAPQETNSPSTTEILPPAAVAAFDDWLRSAVEGGIRELLQQTDHEQAGRFLDLLMVRLQQEDAAGLEQVREGARSLLPLLESYEETLPYALWLRTRLDYFEPRPAATSTAPPAPPLKAPAGVITSKPAAPALTIWDERLRDRPLPSNAPKYLARLRRIFEEEGLPPELVWLAEVESTFEPRAKSPAGAAGLFQLMKPTAQSLGLSTWFPDERLDAEKNARAAARYLKQLHRRFGDWRLVLAAYNAGETRVARLLGGAPVRSFDAIAARLPAETQMYVPKIEATLRRRESVELATLPAPKD